MSDGEQVALLRIHLLDLLVSLSKLSESEGVLLLSAVGEPVLGDVVDEVLVDLERERLGAKIESEGGKGATNDIHNN